MAIFKVASLQFIDTSLGAMVYYSFATASDCELTSWKTRKQ
jgi:hypothetical protein